MQKGKNSKDDLFYGVPPSKWAQKATEDDLQRNIGESTESISLLGSLWRKTVAIGTLGTLGWIGLHTYNHTGDLKEELRQHSPFKTVIDMLNRTP